jgi:signal transduction histidine kinase
MDYIEKLLNNNLTFSEDEWLLKQKIKTIIAMLFVSMFVAILITSIRLFQQDIIVASIDAMGGLILIYLYYLLNKDKKYYDRVSIIFLFIPTIAAIVSLFMADHDIIRAIWFCAVLTLAYYLRDAKEGFRWLVGFLSVIAISYFLNDNPHIVEYILLSVNLILISIVLHFYDKIKEVEQQNLEMKNELLEAKVKKRTIQLEQLNQNLEEKVKDEVAKNIIKDKLMMQQSKMAMMGEMIGNIAHQFRQPLNAIKVSTSTIEFDMELGILDDDEKKKRLKDIDIYVNHLSNTIEDFRNFFKEDKNMTVINLAQSIEKDLFIIESTIVKDKIMIIKNFDFDIEVKVLKNELTQSILNILNNAKDALVQNIEENQRFIFLDILVENNKPTIIIKDNAGGIPDDIIPKIFDDKFTTKEKIDGTGIGLFMTKQMIENHIGGKIIVENEEFEYNSQHQKGAVFKIVLDKIN